MRLCSCRPSRPSSNSRSAAIELTAGAVSGMTAAILTAPLDLAKTRMQVEYMPKSPDALASAKRPRYTNLSGTLRRTLVEEGQRVVGRSGRR
jgi:hypothetical protein